MDGSWWMKAFCPWGLVEKHQERPVGKRVSGMFGGKSQSKQAWSAVSVVHRRSQ